MATFDEDAARMLREHIESLEASVRYYSPQNKAERERWVAQAFLQNLGVVHDPAEVLPSPSDPPDILFRGARIEIKEIIDPGRRRHAEYKAELEKARGASSIFDMIEPFKPGEISITEVFNKCLSSMEALAARHPIAVRQHLDLLFYVNLRHVTRLTEEPFPDIAPMVSHGWRSVSFLKGHRGCCFFAAPGTPEFIARAKQKIIHRVLSGP